MNSMSGTRARELQAYEAGKPTIDEETWSRLSKDLLAAMKSDPSYMPSFAELYPVLYLLRGVEYYRKDHELRNEQKKEWDRYFYKRGEGVYEVWTREYMQRFGDYLARRVEELGGTEENPLCILEVGAGDGRLSKLIQDKMNELAPGKVRIVAVDTGAWRIRQLFPIESSSHREAIKKHQPQIILFSWMPHNYDATADFRQSACVDEYILIGEADGGCCGDAWKTWGKSNPFKKAPTQHEGETPPYEIDGFEKIYHPDLAEVQISRLNMAGRGTTTVSFRRKT